MGDYQVEYNKLSKDPVFVIKAIRFPDEPVVSDYYNTMMVEAVFDYYRQLPGQPETWYGLPDETNKEESTRNPIIARRMRTEWWPDCYELANPEETGKQSRFLGEGVYDDPESHSGHKERDHAVMKAQWGIGTNVYREEYFDYLELSLHHNDQLLAPEVMEEICQRIHALWRSQLVGVVDLSSEVAQRPRLRSLTGAGEMIAGISRWNPFHREEFEDYRRRWEERASQAQ